MVRYFRSHILRKTRKAIDDLDVIFKYYEIWQIFVNGKPIVDKLIEEAVTFQYIENHRTEFRKRLKRKVKRQVDRKAVCKKTKEQLNETINSVLDDLIKKLKNKHQ